MTETIINELDTAARIFMNPSQEVTIQQRQTAEAVLLNFRKMKSPYSLCQQILEQSSTDLLLFEAVDILKNALVIEWHTLDKIYILTMRQYLLNYIITKHQLQSAVREKIIQVIVIIIKRISLNDSGADRIYIINEMDKMLNSGDDRQQFLACRLLNAIIQGYMIIVKSDDTGLSFENHYKVKREFETEHLKRVFIMNIHMCAQFLKIFDKNNTTHVRLIFELLYLHEQIFSWGYISPLRPKRAIFAFEHNIRTEVPMLHLNVTWERIILDPEILNVFFNLYWKVRDLNDAQQKGLTCLVQLSTLGGGIWLNDTTIVVYFGNYVNHFINLLSNIQVTSIEAIGFANIIRKICKHYSIEEFAKLPITNAVLQQMFILTCKFADGSVEEECNSSVDPVYMEALNIILEAWLLIIQEQKQFQRELIQQYSLQIFHKYLQCHLSPPEGLRRNVDNSIHIDEIIEIDHEKYKEQLIIIGTLGRLIPAHSMTLVSKLLEDKLRKLNQRLQIIYSDLNNIRSANHTNKILDDVFEDIHWILMIAGHLLAMESASEEPAIPNEIMSCSLQQLQSGHTNIPTSLYVLGSSNQNISDIPNAENLTDPVVRLVSAVLRLCEIENKAIEVKIYDFLSPELSNTIMWFLGMWAESYLLFFNTTASHLSEVLHLAFGINTPGATWCLNFLLNKICINVQNLSADKKIVKSSLAVFVSLVKNGTHKRKAIFESEYFKQIFKLKSMDFMESKPELYKGLIIVVGCISDVNVQNQYLNEILLPIKNRFSEINWRRGAGNSTIANNLVHILDEIKACTAGASGSMAVRVYICFEEILSTLPKLLGIFFQQTIIIAILELMHEIVHNLMYIVNHCVYDICRNILKIYKNHYDEKSNFFFTSSEDDFLETVLLLLQLMNGLIMKPVVIYVEEEGERSSTQRVDVCNLGLKIVMPLTKTNLLNYPTFCTKYYQTLTFFIDIHTRVISTYSPDLLTEMFESIEIGFQFCGADIQTLCFDFVRLVANHLSSINKCEKLFAFNRFMSFLKMIIKLILNQEVNPDNRSDCSNALLALIICYKDLYNDIIQQILSEIEPQKRDRLSCEFVKLTNDFTFINNRPNQLKFIDNFNQFFVNVNFLHN